MKVRNLTKLALSGVALAAVAATLGTSTYAWYVTNSSATASGIGGSTQAGGLGNILLAQASSETTAKNGHGAFAQNITIDTETTTNTTSGLQPVTPGAYTAADSTASTESSWTPATELTAATWYNVDGGEVSNEYNKYIHFDIWVLSTSEASLNFSVNVTNKTSQPTTQISYASTGSPVAQGNTFAVDIVDALRIGYTQTNYDSAYTGTTAATSVIYDLKSIALDGNGLSYATNTTANTYTHYTDASSANANSYFSAVLGADPLFTTGATAATTISKITVVPNLETKLSFYIWLEGTDAQCFDSVSGQTFDISLTFSK